MQRRNLAEGSLFCRRKPRRPKRRRGDSMSTSSVCPTKARMIIIMTVRYLSVAFFAVPVSLLSLSLCIIHTTATDAAFVTVTVSVIMLDYHHYNRHRQTHKQQNPEETYHIYIYIHWGSLLKMWRKIAACRPLSVSVNVTLSIRIRTLIKIQYSFCLCEFSTDSSFIRAIRIGYCYSWIRCLFIFLYQKVIS